MIVLQLPRVCRSTIGDYSRDRPRTLQNDSLLRRLILFLRMLIEEIKRATRPRCMEERKGRVEATPRTTRKPLKQVLDLPFEWFENYQNCCLYRRSIGLRLVMGSGYAVSQDFLKS
jgi:hypothetical protein